MANLEAGAPVFARLPGRLGHVVGFVGTDGAGENIFSVRLDDDGATFNAGESSLGDPSEAAVEEAAPEVAEAAPVEATPVPESEASSADTTTTEAETEATSDSSATTTEAGE